jgi:hypothetical protein
MAVTMKNAVFRVVKPRGSCRNRRFEGTSRLYHQGEKIQRASVLQLLIIANVVSSSMILSMMIHSMRSSKTSVLTRATQYHIPEDDILHTIMV